MAFGSLEDTPAAAREPMADINTTPLVDVMLVLLVIFIITAPLFTHAVRLDLPDAKSAPLRERDKPVTISIAADGLVYWNDERLADDDALLARLQAAQRDGGAEGPTLQLRADKATRYGRVAFVMAAAQEAGLNRLAFVTEPRPARTEQSPQAAGRP